MYRLKCSTPNRLTQEPTFQKMEVLEKTDQENGPKAQDRNNGRTRPKKRGCIEKWDQTGSPEIPDRGDIRKNPPPLPSGVVTIKSVEIPSMLRIIVLVGSGNHGCVAAAFPCGLNFPWEKSS